MQLINVFLRYLHTCEKKIHTIGGYKYDLEKFESFLFKRYGDTYLPNDGELPQDSESEREIECGIYNRLMPSDIYAYLQSLRTTNGISGINRKLSSVRQFLCFLQQHHQINSNPAAEIHSLRNVQEFPTRGILTVAQANILLQRISGRNQLRDRLIIGLFLLTGVGIEELTHIRAENVFLGLSFLLVDHGRENGRKLYFNDALKSILKDFLFSTHNVNCVYLFSVDGQNPIGTRTVHQLINKHLSNIAMDAQGNSTEILRRSCREYLKVFCKADSREIDWYFGRMNIHLSTEEEETVLKKISDNIDRVPLVFKV